MILKLKAHTINSLKCVLALTLKSNLNFTAYKLQTLLSLVLISILSGSCATVPKEGDPRYFKPYDTENAYNTWTSPTDPNVTLTQKFKPPKNPRHRGVDLAGKSGQPIYAARAGTVVYAGQKFQGYGKMLLVEHDPSWTTLYSHLSQFKVRSGDTVKQGQIIGLMGRTGRASGVHLHFEVYYNKIPQDPLKIVPMKYKTR